MKIAIKANPSRGKEIISLLVNLGGINKRNWNGDGNIDTYYIDKNNIIQYDRAPADYKAYTLEEFETQFPFKIGDKITIVGSPDFPKVITKMAWDCGEILYSFEGLNNTWFGAKALKKFEMKEERNIKLTLKKAKEWYKRGGELKEIALQAFTEKELNPLPRSWEEFSYKYKVSDMRYAMPSKYMALWKLEQLRNCWWNGWEPEWNSSHKYAIINLQGEITVLGCSNVATFLAFPTREMAEEFLKCFRDLIETAGDLI